MDMAERYSLYVDVYRNQYNRYFWVQDVDMQEYGIQ